MVDVDWNAATGMKFVDPGSPDNSYVWQTVEYTDAAPLLNVSLSRARAKLVILADFEYFSRRAPQSTILRLLQAARTDGHYSRMTA